MAATVEAASRGDPPRRGDHGVGQGGVSDFVVSMSLNGRTATARARNLRKAIRIPRSMGSAALAIWPTSPTAGSMPSSSRAACPRGTWLTEGFHRRTRGRYRDVHDRWSMVRPVAYAKSIGILAAQPRITAHSWIWPRILVNLPVLSRALHGDRIALMSIPGKEQTCTESS